MGATLGLNGLTNKNGCYFLNTFNPFQANATFLHPLKKRKTFPANIYLFKVNNRNTRKKGEIYSVKNKNTRMALLIPVKTSENLWFSDVFRAMKRVILVFLLLTLNIFHNFF